MRGSGIPSEKFTCATKTYLDYLVPVCGLDAVVHHVRQRVHNDAALATAKQKEKPTRRVTEKWGLAR